MTVWPRPSSGHRPQMVLHRRPWRHFAALTTGDVRIREQHDAVGTRLHLRTTDAILYGLLHSIRDQHPTMCLTICHEEGRKYFGIVIDKAHFPAVMADPVIQSYLRLHLIDGSGVGL